MQPFYRETSATSGRAWTQGKQNREVAWGKNPNKTTCKEWKGTNLQAVGEGNHTITKSCLLQRQVRILSSLEPHTFQQEQLLLNNCFIVVLPSFILILKSFLHHFPISALCPAVQFLLFTLKGKLKQLQYSLFLSLYYIWP